MSNMRDIKYNKRFRAQRDYFSHRGITELPERGGISIINYFRR